MMLSLAFLSLQILSVVAGNVHDMSTRHRLPKPSTLLPRSNQYKLKDMFHGTDFLKNFDFFTADDPTHGLVDYVDSNTAKDLKLAYVQKDNTTVLAVDDTTQLRPGQKRKSVRISTKKTYNGGLFVADFFAMPHGCSVWPAYWSVGPNWPNQGEIDILEGTHNQPHNQMTLHASSGCKVNQSALTGLHSTLLSNNCVSGNGQNSGCGFSDPRPNTYGHGFNIIAGGVFVHLWTSDSIQVWSFPRTNIPQDIVDQKPVPSEAWGEPVLRLLNNDCNINKHFSDHSLVINTSLCGDFGDATYPSSGCPGDCASAVADPNNFKFAKWMINYIAVYDL